MTKKIKYRIFKLAIRVAKWSCFWGFTYDYLMQADKIETEGSDYCD